MYKVEDATICYSGGGANTLISQTKRMNKKHCICVLKSCPELFFFEVSQCQCRESY